MSPTQTPTSTLAAWLRPNAQKGLQMDTVLVSPETFTSMMFMSSQPKKEFTRERMTDAEKPQKKTKDGVPVWSVQVAAVTWRGKSELITVSVPAHTDPAADYQPGVPVYLQGLMFGVTAKREGGGFTIWCSAEALQSAGQRIKAAS